MSNIITETIEKLQIQKVAANGLVAEYQVDPAVPIEAKMVAAAIQHAGAEIAQAILRTRQ